MNEAPEEVRIPYCRHYIASLLECRQGNFLLQNCWLKQDGFISHY